jgi:DNA polymerase-3 subunit delta
MIYVFHGEDTFTLREALQRLKEAMGPEELREANTSSLSGPHLAPAELLGVCQAVPFLAERRLVLVEGLLSRFGTRNEQRSRRGGPRKELPKEWQEAAPRLKEIPGSTILVFVDPPLDPANPLLELVRPLAQVRTFPWLRWNELEGWVQERAYKKGLELDPQAKRLLLELVGPDLWGMDNALEQLALFCAGQTATAENVEALVSPAREASLLAAVDAVLEGDPRQALRLLTRLLEHGMKPEALVSALGRQVRLALLAQELLEEGAPEPEIGARLGVLSAYPLRKTLSQARGFSRERLVLFHRLLLEADVGLKTGASTDEAAALEGLVAELSLG